MSVVELQETLKALMNSELKIELNGQGKKKKYEKSKIQCFICEKFGHYANGCWHGKGKKIQKNGEEANHAYDSLYII
ncbi:hypothetical protein MTR_1g021527 [Medicago truncatula]|uniref:CCHC-type domain-containing protein n=1 Tax=Medicago truncatula TaxID=3880 RepID=A0A072VF42_MEDTR|nr:hypothetical protein MTR_1g021527 [Medicago truncatula]